MASYSNGGWVGTARKGVKAYVSLLVWWFRDNGGWVNILVIGSSVSLCRWVGVETVIGNEEEESAFALVLWGEGFITVIT